MKKYGCMMYPKHINKKATKCIICKKCGKELTPATAFYYVDGCNCAITNNAPAYCRECYREVYGE